MNYATATIEDFIAQAKAEAEANPALRRVANSVADFERAIAEAGVRFAPPPAPPAVLTPRRATGAVDAESLRVIRNTCAEYMTGNPGQISAEEQRGFMGRAYLDGWRIWLFDDPEGVPVGFGLFRPVGGRWWATLGLLPAWRGRGHGTAIYRHLIAQCPGDLYIDVLLTNVASARAAERAGFRLVDWNGALATLVARKGAR